jgi:hypothetical protein
LAPKQLGKTMNTIYQAISNTGPRSSKSLGYFLDEDVALAIASETEDGSVDAIQVNTSTNVDEYKRSRLVLAGLAKLTSEEKSALGLG